jgi:hypothetical protein
MLRSTSSVRRLDICAFTALAILSAAVPSYGQTISANPTKLSFRTPPSSRDASCISIADGRRQSGWICQLRTCCPHPVYGLIEPVLNSR